MAPFRCSDCQTRFISFATGKQKGKQTHTSLASYFGLGADAGYKAEKWILILSVAGLLLLVAIIILHSSAR